MPDTHAEDGLTYIRDTIGADLDTVLVFSLLRTHRRLKPFISADLREQHLTLPQLNALLTLRAAGPEGMLMSDIGRALVVTRSNVTGLVDRLEEQGLVARAEHQDRRATVVKLTDAGAAVLDRATPRHAERLAELAACLSERDKRTLIRLLAKFRRELRRRSREAG
jgi:DNA-binding MarR family transcriptional regulator